MVRTVINLDSADKDWLDQQAFDRHVAMTEIVREAVHYYRKQVESKKKPGFEELLKKTAGTWKKEDGLAYQTKLRDEWKK